MGSAKFYRIFLMLVLVFGIGAVQAADVWTISPWTNDNSTGINSTETYTHAVNITNVAGTTTVNGVTFIHEYNANATNWSFNAGNNIPNDTNNMTGNSAAWGVFFHYYGTLFQLTGLTPGEIYQLSLFSCGWEASGRIVTLSNGVSSTTFDQDQYGNDNGIRIDGIYQADANGELNLTIPRLFHIYAFANKVYTGVVPIELQSPDNDAIQVGIDAELSWTLAFPVDYELSFDVYMDPNQLKVDSLDPSVLVSSQQTDLSYIPDSPLEYEETYYWRLVPYIDGEPNQPTDIRSFTTDYEVPHWTDASWTNDADSTISAGKTYTHAVNLNGGVFGAVVANGVQFEGPEGREGTNWVLDGAPGGTGGGAINISGSAASLVGGFYYNVPASLTLTDLTPGQDYVLTFYTKGWDVPGIRIVRITTSSDGRTVEYDQNIDGDGNGHTFSHTYTAPESGELTVDFVQWGAGSWHHYAFSNEAVLPVYLDPSPVPWAKISSELDLSWQLHGEVVNPSYNLSVATDANMLNIVIDEAGIPDSTYQVSLDPEVTYYWKVDVVEDGGAIVYESPVWNFLTSPPPDAEKVLEWKMDETAGSIVNQTGTSEDADGILGGFNDPNASTMFVTGLVGNAILLNGTGEHVDISNAHPYMPTADEQPFAVSAYFRTYYGYGPIFSMRHTGYEPGDDVPLIDISIGADGVQNVPGRACMIVRDNNGSISWTNSGIYVNDGRWHSLVVSRASGNWKMYIDGVLRAQLHSVASGEVSLDWLAIGAEMRWFQPDNNGNTWNPTNAHFRFFKGMLDEVCVWAGEMRAHQIEEHAAKVPGPGDLDYDLDTDSDDLAVLTGEWLGDSYTPVQPTAILEDMEAYDPADSNSHEMYWETLTDAGNGLSTHAIEPDPDGANGQVLNWTYSFDGKADVRQFFWLRDRRIDLSIYDQISIRVKKMPGSTGQWFYFDFFDGRGITEPTLSDFIYRKGRVIMSLADVPEDQWVTLTADIPGGFDAASRTFEIHDLYQVTIGISRGSGTTGTLLFDEISLIDGTENCVPQIGVFLPDITGDCKANIEDFALMAANWLIGI